MNWRARWAARLQKWKHRARALWYAFVPMLHGAVLLAVIVLVSALVLGYQPHDASLNVVGAPESGTQHWAGAFGAWVADIILQTIGHVVWVILVPLAALAVRRMRGVHISYPKWRMTAALMAIVLMSFGLALYDVYYNLTSIAGNLPLSGSVGQLLYGGAVVMFASLPAGVVADLFVLPPNIIIGALVVLLLALGAGLALVASGWLLASGRLLVASFYFLSRISGFITRPSSDAPDTTETTGDMHPPENAAENSPESLLTPAVAARRAAPRPSRRSAREAQPSLALAGEQAFELPPLRLLKEQKGKKKPAELSKDALESNARLLETVLSDFGVRGRITTVRPGPVVTLYELELAAGVRTARVVGLADDIARSMSAVSCRVAPVLGANVIGIELPNPMREMVGLRELLASADFESDKDKLTLALGKDIGGTPIMTDLAKMPHLLVAGTTGSGKSVGINSMILSLLYRLSPEECRLILVDPKMLELSVYDGIPHLLTPVVTEPKKAVVALKWAVLEMENRYRKMAKINVRNIDGFNARMRAAMRDKEVLTRRVQTGFDGESGEAIFEEEEITPELLPFIVVVIDEMADLMLVAGKEIEAAVQRLAQMARAAGVHLITATQRPSVDVITGTIKANFPSRISFQVTSKIDSRTVLGEQGAEQLLGQGDMLFMEGGGRICRVHGAFVSDGEVERVVGFLKKQAAPAYIEQVVQEPEDAPDMESDPQSDSLYDQAVAIVTRDGRASTSYVQRRLQIGYNRAARLIEQMEEQGVISPPNHAGKREILVGKH